MVLLYKIVKVIKKYLQQPELKLLLCTDTNQGVINNTGMLFYIPYKNSALRLSISYL